MQFNQEVYRIKVPWKVCEIEMTLEAQMEMWARRKQVNLIVNWNNRMNAAGNIFCLVVQ